MATASKKRSAKSSKSNSSGPRYVGKPAGVIQHRVEVIGPSHFGVVSVDCAKRRSKWMLLDFYGRVLIEPAVVEHNAGSLAAMTARIKEALAEFSIKDSIAAVEMTGIYQKPVQAALRKAGMDTRKVHPFVSKHYQRPLHPDQKTDDKDLDPKPNHVPPILPPYAATCRTPFLDEERNLAHFNKNAYTNSQQPSGPLNTIPCGIIMNQWKKNPTIPG